MDSSPSRGPDGALRAACHGTAPGTGTAIPAIEQNVRGGAFISRADVAAFMLALAARPGTAGQVLAIAN